MIDLIQNLIPAGAFHFLRPVWLLSLLPIALAAIYVRKLPGSNSHRNKLVAAHLLPALTVSGGTQRWYNPVNMGLLVLTLCGVLLSGPSWQQQASPFVEDEAVLVIALDLSNTMNQTDVQPSRLERAKQKVADLIALRGNARTGLIAYSGSAHQLLPLGNDPDIIRQFLAAVDSSMMPKPGKFPEKIIPLAAQMLADANAPGTLLLIGDGVSPETLKQFESFFNEAPYQLLVLGVGLAVSADIISENQQFGGAHLALQQEELRSLASVAGGKYINLELDKSDVHRIYRLVDQHLTQAGQSGIPWQDAGYYLLYPIAIICLLWFRRGWTLNWCLALCFIYSIDVVPPVYAEEAIPQKSFISSDRQSHSERFKNGFLDLWLTPDQQGRYYFEQGDYQRAAQRFQSPLWQGLAFYYAENFSAAAEVFRQIDNSEGQFNLANALAQGQNYVQSVNVYTSLLGQEPGHGSAAKNIRLVQQIIDDINRMSASQQTEQGEATRDLGDAPQRADGAERGDIASDKVEQLSSDQLLADEQVYDMWMRQVQADPQRFLRAKFQLQYNKRRATAND